MRKKIRSFLRPRLIKYFKKVMFMQNEVILERLKEAGLLEIGKHTYGKIVVDAYEGSESKITIGKYCSISRDVRFINGGIHPVDWVSLYPFRIRWNQEGAYKDGMPTTKGPIHVMNDVWIGTGTTIFSGVTIGDGAIIMAGSIVSKDVPPFTIVGGIPARVIRPRFSLEEIEALQKIQWWEWEEKKIAENIELLSSPDLNDFITKFETDIKNEN